MDEIKVLYEDTNFICLAKPAGVLVHRSVNHKAREGEIVLTDWLLSRYPELGTVGDEPTLRPGIVHRLDRDTSGVMVVARNQESFSYLKHLFQRHEVKKTYVALVFGRPLPPSGVINKPIALKQGTLRRTTHGKNIRLLKEARTAYRTLHQYTFRDASFTLLAVSPETGRTHQIRVHLASIGNPVVSDRLYGASKEKLELADSLGLHRQFLHAETIEFTDFEGKRLRVSDDLPPNLLQALDQLLPAEEGHSRGN